MALVHIGLKKKMTMQSILIIFSFLSFLVTSVTADTYYIVPTDSTPCPTELTTAPASGSTTTSDSGSITAPGGSITASGSGSTTASDSGSITASANGSTTASDSGSITAPGGLITASGSGSTTASYSGSITASGSGSITASGSGSTITAAGSGSITASGSGSTTASGGGSTTASGSESTTTSGSESLLVTPTDPTQLDENVICLTLTQYAQLWSEPVPPATGDSNITLIFHPGHHILDYRLRIKHVDSLVLRTATAYSSPPITSVVIRVTCMHSSGFDFESISEVVVSGLVFSNCRENSVRSVNRLMRIKDCRFQDGHGVEFRNVRNATLERSTFTNLTAFNFNRKVITFGRYTRQSADIRPGGAVVAFRSDMAIAGCLFERNTAANFGGALAIMFSRIAIHRSNFTQNIARTGPGGAIWNWFIGNVSIYDSYFNYNRARSGGAILIEYPINSTRLHGTNINNNIADDGSTISNADSLINIHGCTFRSNLANANVGGAIRTWDTRIEVHDSNFISNRARRDGGAIAVSSGPSIQCHHSTFSYNTARRGGALYIVPNSGDIVGCNFIRNRAVNGAANGGAVYLVTPAEFVGIPAELQSPGIRFNNSIFDSNHAAERGGAIYVTGRTLCSFNGFLHITNNSAKTGVVFAQQSTLLISGITTIIGNKASFYSFDSNIAFDGLTEFINNSHIHGTGVEEGGAVTALQSEIVFAGTVNILYNTNDYFGGAVLSSESNIYTHGDITIAHNSALSGGGIFAYQSELEFSEGRTTMSENVGIMRGGGIYAVGSSIRLSGGQLEINKNRAERGGGFYLELNSKLHIIKTLVYLRHLTYPSTWICSSGSMQNKCYRINNLLAQPLDPGLYCSNNLADYGGALYIDDTNSGTCIAKTVRRAFSSSECFIQSLALHGFVLRDSVDKSRTFLQSMFFLNNSASTSGGTIFGGLFDRCTVSPDAEVFFKDGSENTTTLDAISYLTNITNIQRYAISSEISSEPVRVCFCTDGQPDCDSPPPSYEVNKGEIFSISLVAVDQVGNPIPSSVRAVLSSNLGGLADGQIIQSTTTNCTDLNFTITSPSDSETLVLYAEGPCSDIGISQAHVNVTFLPCNCPIGFIKTDETSYCNCQCDPCLYNSITDCSFANSLIQRSANVWISYINETEDDFEINYYENTTMPYCPYLTYPYCPFDYCHPSSSPVWINLNTFNGSDAQCAFNRTGKLCGSCKDGFSLTLGSSHCRPCSNGWLALLIVFAIAGVALVAFLLVFNLTVAVGTINGLIFYANILAIKRATFFPFRSPNLFTIFIAWLNLDFGFETCFFNGMDSYAKEWLQLAFPIYIIFIVTMVIIGCEYSTRISRLFSKINPVATLATLILLTYAKCLRIIIAAFSYATLKHPDGSQEIVWLIDANVHYLKGKHFPLFLVAFVIVLVGITYTSLLFSYQWLLRCPNSRALRWLQNARFYPFMDAYLAPYNLKHRYWTGLLLLVRAFIYVIAAFNVSGDPRNNLLLINCSLVCLLLLKLSLPGRMYKSWPLDVLESSFIINLVLFSVGSLYSFETGVRNRKFLAYTSTTIAFITFLAILTYHMFAFMLPKKAQSKISSLKFKQLFTKSERSNNHEIIVIRESAVTHTVIDGVPSQDELDMDNERGHEATTSNLDDRETSIFILIGEPPNSLLAESDKRNNETSV